MSLDLPQTRLSVPGGAPSSSRIGATISRQTNMTPYGELRGALTTSELPATRAGTPSTELDAAAFCGGLSTTTPSGLRTRTSRRGPIWCSSCSCLRHSWSVSGARALEHAGDLPLGQLAGVTLGDEHVDELLVPTQYLLVHPLCEPHPGLERVRPPDGCGFLGVDQRLLQVVVTGQRAAGDNGRNRIPVNAGSALEVSLQHQVRHEVGEQVRRLDRVDPVFRRDIGAGDVGTV